MRADGGAGTHPALSHPSMTISFPSFIHATDVIKTVTCTPAEAQISYTVLRGATRFFLIYKYSYFSLYSIHILPDSFIFPLEILFNLSLISITTTDIVYNNH